MNIVKTHRMGSVLTEKSFSIPISSCEQLCSKLWILINLIFLTSKRKKQQKPFRSDLCVYCEPLCPDPGSFWEDLKGYFFFTNTFLTPKEEQKTISLLTASNYLVLS